MPLSCPSPKTSDFPCCIGRTASVNKTTRSDRLCLTGMLSQLGYDHSCSNHMAPSVISLRRQELLRGCLVRRRIARDGTCGQKGCAARLWWLCPRKNTGHYFCLLRQVPATASDSASLTYLSIRACLPCVPTSLSRLQMSGAQHGIMSVKPMKLIIRQNRVFDKYNLLAYMYVLPVYV